MQTLMAFEMKGKINFIDSRNRFVGFDTEWQCCESFGWTVSLARMGSFPPVEIRESVDALNAALKERCNGHWIFFSEKLEDHNPRETHEPSEDCANNASFTLVNHLGEKVGLLTLYNHHNGYYAHGYTLGELKSTISESL